MTPEAIWLLGLVVGVSLGIPLGFVLSRALDPVDRWLDAHWRR